MRLEKRFYNRLEVERLLNDYISAYERVIAELKQKNAELVREADKSQRKIYYYESKEGVITASIKNATEKAEEIIKQAESVYELSVKNLETFQAELDGFIKKHLKSVSEKNLKEVIRVRDGVSEALSLNGSSEDKIKTARRVLTKKGEKPETVKKTQKKDEKEETFNPEQIIKDYIAITKEERFDMDEIINPKGIDLEEICKEMGLNGRK